MIADDAARLETLLAALPPGELSALLGRRRFIGLHDLVSTKSHELFSEELVARYAIALDGARLLEQPPILSALLLGLEPKQLRSIASRHLDRVFNRDADNALALASKPVRPGTAITRDILGSLGLTERSMHGVERRASVDFIEPYEPLPILMDFQSEVKGRCTELFSRGARELLVQMPTGSGKTRTAMELVVDLDQRLSVFARGLSVIWLAHTEELCEQAIDSFSSVWAARGSQRVPVARLWGTYSPPEPTLSGALIVAGTSRIHSLSGNEPELFKSIASRVALVVIDEAHRALAPTVTSQLAALRGSGETLLVGLSATPARNLELSSENRALAKIFGHNLVTPQLGDDPIAELRRRGVLSELQRVELNYGEEADGEHDEENIDLPPSDEDLPESTLTSLAMNKERNLAILDKLQERVSPAEPAIVFCCSVQHADLLAAALRLRGLRAASVDCRMPRGTRRLVVQQFARGEIDVLLNYGVLSTGFDAPRVRTVVIARPTKSVILYSQMLGRGLRGPAMGGTAACTLIDVRDHLGRFGNLSDVYRRFQPYWVNSKV